MTPRKPILATIAIGALAAAVVLGMRLGGRPAVPEVAQLEPLSGTEASASAPVAPDLLERPLPRGQQSPQQLPPVDTPLADVFDDLAARAARGDDRAACRLAFEMATCHSELPWMRFMSRNAEAYATIDPSGLEEEQLPQLEQRMEHVVAQMELFDATEAHCAGVPEIPPAQQMGWWRQAALAGHRDAARGYVGGEALPLARWMQNLGSLAQLQRDIEPLAWRQMQAGDLDMAWQLMVAYMPLPELLRSDTLGQVVGPDAERALALAHFLREAVPRAGGGWDEMAAVDGYVAELEMALGPVQRQRAESQGREWSRQIDPIDIPESRARLFAMDPVQLRERNRERTQGCGEG